MAYQSSEYANSHSGMFPIPSDAVAGAKRMRIVSHWLSMTGSIDPCETNFSYGEFEDYTINLLVPSCPAPSALVVSNVTATEATLEWTENGAATEWEVVYGAVGFDHETEGATVSVTVTPSTLLTELEGSGQYDFYVKSICDENDESGFVGPYTFRTACVAITSLPYLENFDSYASDDGSFPACWERITYTSGSEVWPAILSQNAISGPNTLKFKSGAGIPTYAISPAFVEDITNLKVTFMLQRESASSGTIDVGVMSDASDADTFELVQTINPTHNEQQEYTIDFNQASLSSSGNFIALRHNSNSSIFYYWLDDFEVNLSSSCVAPTALSTTNISTTTADVEWTAGGSETTWDVSWGTQGYTPGDSDEINTIVVTSTNYQIADLNAHTNYDVYVSAICDELQSGWVSISFTSGDAECESPLGITVNNVTGNSAEITWSPANAGDNKWEVSLTTGGQSADQGLIATVSGTASYIATGLDSETHYSVYLRTICSEDVSSSWAYNGDFTTLEGTEEPDACVSPLGITVNNITGNSAEITWSPANAGDNKWAISLTTGGQAADQGIIAAVTGTPSFTATGLAAETTYSVYLLTVCSEEVSSGWAFNGDFTTLEGGEEPEECDAATGVEVSEITATTVTVNWNASATAVNGYVVGVYEAGADIDTDTAVFTEVVGVGGTTVQVTDLAHLTSYDVYVTSDCGSGETAISDVVTFTTDDIASVEDFDFVKLTLYPNPVSTDLNISATKVIDEVQVYNILGQRVMTYKSNNTEVTLDVTNLPSATYVLKIRVKGVVSTVKFVKK